MGSWWSSQTDPQLAGPGLSPPGKTPFFPAPRAQPASLNHVGTWTWVCPGDG